ncbi:hypothetical protein CPB84DRAFT_1448706 [Gymnopilus junonius]|uniref:F-box domain-containing protein n=1 Tax=Gymnopilus junonius TaxID=109634 RepID=A0A9P5NGB8_GYMJU|nr:hypothetical protein CPB84DRAFT_1448706 [Gymnopilus junonius]
MGASILSIAPEVLEMIGNMSDLEDIKNLRLCCRQLGQFLKKSILETISYNINVLNASASITKLQCLGSGASPGASRTTTNLILKRLTLKCNYNPGDTECYIDGKLAPVPKLPDDAELLSIEQETKKCLLPALTALENVNSVSWRVLYQDNEWAQGAAMQAILSFKHLRSLRLEFNTVVFGLPLHHLRGIEEISIVADDAKDTSGHRAQIWSNLAEMLSLNTNLTSLTVQVGNYMAYTYMHLMKAFGALVATTRPFYPVARI